MKIHIFLNLISGPYGGGNQFLKALRDYFISKNVYEHNPKLADIILFNSHHQFKELIQFKKKYPEKIFIHRIDGPVSLIRKNDKETDKLIYAINNSIADATIFQSEWSEKENIINGIKNNKFTTTIINAPNNQIFNKINKLPFNLNRKTKIIATSWSHNLIKGFETYKWLDKNLDFSKYEMTVCGNTPFEFKNIKHINPLPSEELAKVLKDHDIYITASQKDPCSNSLIEALHCGLPAIALNDGGHPEIVGKGGLTYNKPEEIPQLLGEIKNNFKHFQSKINLPSMQEVGNKYIEFIQDVSKNINTNKNFRLLNLINIKKEIIKYRFLKNFRK